MKNLFRIIALQSLWLLLVKRPWIFPQELVLALSIVYVAVDIWFFSVKKSKEVVFAIFLVIGGIILDSILLNLKFINFTGWEKAFSAYFMWAVWLIFIPYYSMTFTKLNFVVTILLSVIFAPFAYFSGQRLGAIEIYPYGIFAIAVLWGLYFPLSVKLYRRYMYTPDHL